MARSKLSDRDGVTAAVKWLLEKGARRVEEAHREALKAENFDVAKLLVTQKAPEKVMANQAGISEMLRTAPGA